MTESATYAHLGPRFLSFHLYHVRRLILKNLIVSFKKNPLLRGHHLSHKTLLYYSLFTTPFSMSSARIMQTITIKKLRIMYIMLNQMIKRNGKENFTLSHFAGLVSLIVLSILLHNPYFS